MRMGTREPFAIVALASVTRPPNVTELRATDEALESQ